MDIGFESVLEYCPEAYDNRKLPEEKRAVIDIHLDRIKSHHITGLAFALVYDGEEQVMERPGYRSNKKIVSAEEKMRGAIKEICGEVKNMENRGVNVKDGMELSKVIPAPMTLFTELANVIMKQGRMEEEEEKNLESAHIADSEQ